jgi:hypothetical protein
MSSRPWARRGKQATAIVAGFGAGAFGGFVMSLFRRRNPTRYLASAPPPEPIDDTKPSTQWLT